MRWATGPEAGARTSGRDGSRLPLGAAGKQAMATALSRVIVRELECLGTLVFWDFLVSWGLSQHSGDPEPTLGAV